MSVVAVNVEPWSPLEEWVAYWKSKGANDVIWATDTDQSVVRAFQVRTLGTTIIIDRDGRISYRDDGATPYEVLKTALMKVL